MTSNFELFDFAQKKRLGKISILCKDELSKVKLRPNLNFIINMADSDEGSGTHWVALFISHNLQSFYFDQHVVSKQAGLIHTRMYNCQYRCSSC